MKRQVDIHNYPSGVRTLDMRVTFDSVGSPSLRTGLLGLPTMRVQGHSHAQQVELSGEELASLIQAAWDIGVERFGVAGMQSFLRCTTPGKEKSVT